MHAVDALTHVVDAHAVVMAASPTSECRLYREMACWPRNTLMNTLTEEQFARVKVLFSLLDLLALACAVSVCVS